MGKSIFFIGKALLVVFSVATLFSCGGVYRVDRVIENNDFKENKSWVGKIKGEDSYTLLNLDTYRFSEDKLENEESIIHISGKAFRSDFLPDSNNSDDTANCYTDNRLAYTKALHCKRDRNRLQIIIMNRSDEVCAKHLSDIKATSTNFNLGFGLASMALAGVSSVVTGEVVKSALSAGSAFAGGSKSLINEEVYRKEFVESIMKAIDESRFMIANNVVARQSRSLLEYPIDAAIRDAVDYHERCSFYRGIKEITKAVDEKRSAAKDDLQNQLTDIRAKIQTKHAEVVAAAANKSDYVKILETQLNNLHKQESEIYARMFIIANR